MAAKKKTAKSKEESESVEATEEKKVYGPLLYKRDEHNLLVNVDYVFNQDGTVDWRSMIKPEFLYPNKSWFASRNRAMPSSIEGLTDKQLLIMLGGIKELAQMRGYTSVDYEVTNVSNDYVVAKCKIVWIGNYETNGEVVCFEDIGNATAENCNDFCLKFLETIACNRAFVRCVRNFLNIHIVGADELDTSNDSENKNKESVEEKQEFTPSSQLAKLVAAKLGEDFEEFKECHLKNFWREDKYKNPDAKDWEDFEDVPAKEARKLIEIIKEL